MWISSEDTMSSLHLELADGGSESSTAMNVLIYKSNSLVSGKLSFCVSEVAVITTSALYI